MFDYYLRFRVQLVVIHHGVMEILCDLSGNHRFEKSASELEIVVIPTGFKMPYQFKPSLLFFYVIAAYFNVLLV